MALNGAGYWAELVDREFRHAFTTDELRLSWGEPLGLSTVPLGAFYFGEEASAVRLAAAGGPNTIESQRTQFAAIGGVGADRRSGRARRAQRDGGVGVA